MGTTRPHVKIDEGPHRLLGAALRPLEACSRKLHYLRRRDIHEAASTGWTADSPHRNTPPRVSRRPDAGWLCAGSVSHPGSAKSGRIGCSKHVP